MNNRRINSPAHAVYPVGMTPAPKSLSRRMAAAISMFVLALIIGCGGGGGGSSTSATSSAGLATTIEVRDAENYAVSASSMRAGDTYSLILWGRDSSGNVIFGSASDWSTSASSAIATVTGDGTISVNSGGSIPLSAVGGTSTRTVTAVSAGGVVRGKVRNTNNQGVPDAVVRFYNNAGTQVATSATGSNGSFRTVVPGTATTFLVDFSSLGARYYNQFGFGDKEWSTICSAYRAPLPARTGSQVVTLPGDIVVTRNSGAEPPPPPPNCGL